MFPSTIFMSINPKLPILWNTYLYLPNEVFMQWVTNGLFWLLALWGYLWIIWAPHLLSPPHYMSMSFSCPIIDFSDDIFYFYSSLKFLIGFMLPTAHTHHGSLHCHLCDIHFQFFEVGCYLCLTATYQRVEYWYLKTDLCFEVKGVTKDALLFSEGNPTCSSPLGLFWAQAVHLYSLS